MSRVVVWDLDTYVDATRISFSYPVPTRHLVSLESVFSSVTQRSNFDDQVVRAHAHTKDSCERVLWKSLLATYSSIYERMPTNTERNRNITAQAQK